MTIKLEGTAEWLSQWHGVEATAEEAGEVPQCYTPKEWRLFWVAANASSGKKKFKHELALKMACEDCQVDYQKLQIAKGRCHPPTFGISPLFRGDDQEE